MKRPSHIAPIPVERITQSILVLRGHRVLLDADLAALYEVPTKRLNEQIKRNIDRFPEDFMFRLTREEVEVLNRSQIATGSQKHRDPRFPPYAFMEHGAINQESRPCHATNHCNIKGQISTTPIVTATALPNRS